MNKYTRSFNEIWHERKRTVGSMLLLFAVVMVIIMGVRTVSSMIDITNIRDILNAPAEQHKYPNLFNASRYFFRIYYPDDWEVSGETNGFFKNESTGLVAEMYPLVYADPVTPKPGSDPSVTAAVSFDKVRDRTLTVSFRYLDYSDEMLEEAGKHETAAGTAKAVLTPAPDDKAATPAGSGSALLTPQPVKTDISLLDIAAKAFYDDFVAGAGEGHAVSTLNNYKNDLYTFRYFTHSYTDGELFRHTADVYILARSSNYIVIEYESVGDAPGTPPVSYEKYRSYFLDILNEFRLSVFED